jgi:hypothetical protein
MASGRLANMDATDRGVPDGAAVDAPADEWLEELTPRQIVAELDKYIFGQTEAKRPSSKSRRRSSRKSATSVATSNRWCATSSTSP